MFAVDELGSVDNVTLYHVTLSADGTKDLEPIDTAPSFLDAAKSQKETFAFGFCSLAVASAASATSFKAFAAMSQRPSRAGMALLCMS